MQELPHHATMLDVGCGPGMQSLELALLTQGSIIAVDTHQPYLDELDRRALTSGLSSRIETRNRSMFELDFPDATFDAIWSEGAIYFMGFENGLRSWRRLLKPRGYIAVSEATWLRPDPPEAARAFWDAAYPAMTDIETNLALLRAAGYEDVGHFALPASDWWTDYYTPIEARIVHLREKYRNVPDALRVIDEEQKEIDLFREFSDWYGYVFYVMRASSSS
ncbi:MAG: class I SAM-dependent methyltransferase [Candidatus Hydrogenedentales bacterium]